MKIVIIHQHFRTPSEGGSIRSYYLAKELTRRNHSVTVLTASYHNRSENRSIENFTVQYIPVSYDNSFGFIRRMLAYSLFVFKILLRIHQFKGYHCCYTISTPLSVGIISILAKRLYRIPYAFEVGDIWPDIPIQMGFIRNRVFKWMVLRLEYEIYKQASLIVAISEPVKELIANKISGKEILVLPNFSDNEFFKPSDKDPLLLQKYRCQDKFVISYIGTIGIANKVESLIILANMLGPEVRVFIKGSGAEMRLIDNKIKELQCNNVSILPFGNKDEVKELLSVTDALYICFDERYPLLNTGCPNKLCDGLAAGKLIIINYQGWQKEILEENQAGVYVKVDNPDNLIKIISNKTLVDQYKANALIISSRFELPVLIDSLNTCLLRIF